MGSYWLCCIVMINIIIYSNANYLDSCDDHLCHKNTDGNYICCQEDDPQRRGEFTDKQICCNRRCGEYFSFRTCVESINKSGNDKNRQFWFIFGMVLGFVLMNIKVIFLTVFIRHRRKAKENSTAIAGTMNNPIQLESNLHADYDQPTQRKTQTSSAPESTNNQNGYSSFINDFLNSWKDNNTSRKKDDDPSTSVTISNQDGENAKIQNDTPKQPSIFSNTTVLSS